MGKKIVFSLLMPVILALMVISCCKKLTQPAVKSVDAAVIPVATAEPLWKEVNPQQLTVVGKQISLPTQYKVFQINTSKMKELLQKTVMDSLSKGKKTESIEFPFPDGSIKTFIISETATMSPGLLAKYPHLRTYGGKCKEDPTSTVKLDFMQNGLHAYFFTQKGSILLQPFSEGDVVNYLCYYKQFSTEVKQTFEIQADSIK